MMLRLSSPSPVTRPEAATKVAEFARIRVVLPKARSLATSATKCALRAQNLNVCSAVGHAASPHPE
jgi:hypothetical protein